MCWIRNLELIKIKDTEITFYGISNAYFSPTFDLSNEFELNKNTYNILLAHIPMYKDYESFGADLTLCGDTHGGSDSDTVPGACIS